MHGAAGLFMRTALATVQKVSVALVDERPSACVWFANPAVLCSQANHQNLCNFATNISYYEGPNARLQCCRRRFGSTALRGCSLDASDVISALHAVHS